MGDESTSYIGQRVVVASIQTLYSRVILRRQLELPPCDELWIDEAHHSRAQTYLAVRDAYPSAKRVGLSATPARGDGRGLGGDLFSDLVRVPTYAWLIDKKHLVPPIVYAPVNPDLQGVRTLRTGDYSPGELQQRMDTPRLVGGIIENWHRHAGDRQTILFASGVAHSKHLEREFQAADVEAAHIDAHTPLEHRKAIIKAFRERRIRVLCNAMIFVEGFDEPSAGCIVLARPTKLLTLYRQMAGRGMRPWPGKTDCIVLDHSGSVFRHRFPDDEIQWSLEPDETAVNKSALTRANGHQRELTSCPRCQAIRLQGEPCRACGWMPTTLARALDVQEGDLGRVQRDGSVRPTQWTVEEQEAFYRQLMGIALRRQYELGWVYHQFKDKFGFEPQRSWKNKGPLPPGGEVNAWVRAKHVAYRRSLGR
jgi:superfamily II DNA or RNA helicase